MRWLLSQLILFNLKFLLKFFQRQTKNRTFQRWTKTDCFKNRCFKDRQKQIVLKIDKKTERFKDRQKRIFSKTKPKTERQQEK